MSTHIPGYFLEAFLLIFSKGFRKFIILPLLLNLIIFILLTVAALGYAQSIFIHVANELPDWLAWVQWFIWPMLVGILLIAYAHCFNLMTTVVAAPFLGLLAEKVETHITGAVPTEEPLTHLIPRTFKRELKKLSYFLPRSLGIGLLILLLVFLPGANIVGVILGGIWGCWCLSLQFCDYAADNHQLPFHYVREQLSKQKFPCYLFGGLVLIGSMIPLLNIVITPLSVAAGTLYWVRRVNYTHQVAPS